MVTIQINKTASHFVLAPNRALETSLQRLHMVWVAVVFLYISVIFTLMGAWPIAITVMVALLCVLYALIQVAEAQLNDERFIVDIDRVEIRHGDLKEFTATNSQPTIYVKHPLQLWAPLQFELHCEGHSPVMFAKTLNRSDGEELRKLVKNHGLTVI